MEKEVQLVLEETGFIYYLLHTLSQSISNFLLLLKIKKVLIYYKKFIAKYK